MKKLLLLNTMKKLLLLLMIIPMIGLGQENEILTLQNEVDNINYRMNKHHKQYSIGMILNTCGVVSTIIGGSNSNNDLIIAGSGISLIGSIIVCDSHKWFSINKNIYSKNGIPLILPNLKSNNNKQSKEPIKKIKLKTKNPVF
jgi:hypothetical protein